MGGVATSGNTNTRSVNGKAEVRHLKEPWLNQLKLDGLWNSDGEETTAERYLVSAKTEYRFRKREYVFGTLRYEDDRFSGYEYQVSETVGYGRRIVDRPSFSMDLEGGAGGRHQRPEGEEREDQAIARGATKLAWDISPTSRFTEELLVESGHENTFAESITALKVKINSNLAMKTAVTVRHNTSVPPDKERTDTITAVTLVYDF